ncbi:MAG TPA: flagellar biosynthetic protein FliQ [Candidatus Sulfotelmatobacter sp.]|nr:flagellar biosynthetic protein FliQ [Candidatus Sulfotelmatobacter sp.]
MSPTLAAEMIRNAVTISLMVAGPLLITALVVGVLVSLIQAITQLQEQTLTFIPKLVLIALVFLATLPWTLTRLVEYLVQVLRSLPTLAA